MQWDVFCRVIDHHGDLGVCWRLAADLASRGEQVRLFVRDPAKLAAVGVDVDAPGLQLAIGDLLDPASIPPALQGVKRIHHIAGSISLGRHVLSNHGSSGP